MRNPEIKNTKVMTSDQKSFMKKLFKGGLGELLEN